MRIQDRISGYSSPVLQQGTDLSCCSLPVETMELIIPLTASGAGIFTDKRAFSLISNILLHENTSWQKMIQIKGRQVIISKFKSWVKNNNKYIKER